MFNTDWNPSATPTIKPLVTNNTEELAAIRSASWTAVIAQSTFVQSK